MPKVYDPEYYLKNRDTINARTMKNYYKNRVERLERFREYYEKNKEALKEKRAERSKPKPVFQITHNITVKFD